MKVLANFGSQPRHYKCICFRQKVMHLYTICTVHNFDQRARFSTGNGFVGLNALTPISLEGPLAGARGGIVPNVNK